MKAYLLATAAALVLSVPALAAGQGQTTGAAQQTQYQQSGMQNAQHISPSALSQDEVKKIQQALTDRGFSAGELDGQWGPQTQQALTEFRSQQNLSAADDLDRETLSALGVEVAAMSDPSDADTGTTGAGSTVADEPAGAADQPGDAQTDQSTQQ